MEKMKTMRIMARLHQDEDPRQDNDGTGAINYTSRRSQDQAIKGDKLEPLVTSNQMD